MDRRSVVQNGYMPKKDECQLHKRIACIFCHVPRKSRQKKELRRYTLIRQKSPQQEEYDRLHQLLKHA